MVIKLSRSEIEKCRDFANTRTDQSLSLYQFRGEHRRQKIFADIFYGTLAECAISNILPNCSKPDLEIYTVDKKSFSKDLKFKDLNIHVKSQGVDSANAYGISWIFQRQDPLLTSPSEKDIFALALVYPHLEIKVLGFLKSTEAKFDELKVERYRGTKKALYFDLIKHKLYDLTGGNYEFSKET
jgi:hypothetical protein